MPDIFDDLLYAEFTMPSGKARIAAFNQLGEIIIQALNNGCIYFRTFELPLAVDHDGVLCRGQPQRFSGRQFVGAERILTRDEAVTKMEASTAQPPGLSPRESFDHVMRHASTLQLISYYKNFDAGEKFIDLRDHGIIHLNPEDRVFGPGARVIFPPPWPEDKNSPRPPRP